MLTCTCVKQKVKPKQEAVTNVKVSTSCITCKVPLQC